MQMMSGFSLLALVLGMATCIHADEQVRVLIIDGQNNHNWRETTPILRNGLLATGRFSVDVATSPSERQDLSEFHPHFANYDVVLSNYNGSPWSDQTRADFEAYVRGGGGFVCVHAANNAFPEWSEYNEICGLGGWHGRNEDSGPYVYLKNGEVIRDQTPGRGGHHGPQHEFQVTVRDVDHPITRGLLTVWMHTKDELYDRLRGPAHKMSILATAYSDPAQDGTGRDEPMLMTIFYGQGRGFHTVLGHADYSMKCVGFMTTLSRGTEWAATGEVSIPVPADFPTASTTRARD